MYFACADAGLMASDPLERFPKRRLCSSTEDIRKWHGDACLFQYTDLPMKMGL
jgi:hypothetical protein